MSKVKTHSAQRTAHSARVVVNKNIQGPYFKIIIEALEIAIKALPGQFVTIKIAEDDEPLLRRPFSIHRAQGKTIEILYEVVGKGTEILSQKKVGEDLDVIGPLGSGFSYHLSLAAYRLPILIAGGMGVAPIFFLAEQITNDYPKFDIEVLVGSRTAKQLLCENEFKKLGCSVKISTDDGSRGFRGKVTQLLENMLSDSLIRQERPMLYACGPRPMLRKVYRLVSEYKIPAQISLEEHMACGIGACFGCAVKTREGFKRVCKEGPVFNAGEIVW
jgi:dihydroorotate dehydrogenase electron transfer subunit